MVHFPETTFLMGTDEPQIPLDAESPRRPVHLDGFFIDRSPVRGGREAGYRSLICCCLANHMTIVSVGTSRQCCKVTNAEFSEFVGNTSFMTDSEKFGWSFVFHLAVSPVTNPCFPHIMFIGGVRKWKRR